MFSLETLRGSWWDDAISRITPVDGKRFITLKS